MNHSTVLLLMLGGDTTLLLIAVVLLDILASGSPGFWLLRSLPTFAFVYCSTFVISIVAKLCLWRNLLVISVLSFSIFIAYLYVVFEEMLTQASVS